MDHSVTAYLKRLPREKAEVLLPEWSDVQKQPPYVSAELLEILQKKVQDSEAEAMR